MKKVTSFLFFTLLVLHVSGTTWTVTTPGFNFSPATLTIQVGDTVIFDIDNLHTVLEVSQDTWNANGTTPLAGGFSLPLGGGVLFPEDLPVGTHWFVCEPHASEGMKGMIVVEGISALDGPQESFALSVFPNPSDGRINITLHVEESPDHFDLVVYDMQGMGVYARSELTPQMITELDLSAVASGMYVLKLYTVSGSYSRKIILR